MSVVWIRIRVRVGVRVKDRVHISCFLLHVFSQNASYDSFLIEAKETFGLIEITGEII